MSGASGAFAGVSPVDVLAVAVGGAGGAVARFLVSLALARWLGASFPWGTLAVNVAGSFVLGAVAGVAQVPGAVHPTARALVGTGFCGGFTTFSTFAVETIAMPARLAALNAGANLAASCAAAAAGYWLGRTLRGGPVGV